MSEQGDMVVWRTLKESYFVFSKRRDVEDCVAQVVVYEGRAGVPILKGFKKLFFRHPATKELYGHVDVGYWPLGAYFYPLYFRCNLGVEIFPGTPFSPLDVLPIPWSCCSCCPPAFTVYC